MFELGRERKAAFVLEKSIQSVLCGATVALAGRRVLDTQGARPWARLGKERRQMKSGLCSQEALSLLGQ